MTLCGCCNAAESLPAWSLCGACMTDDMTTEERLKASRLSRQLLGQHLQEANARARIAEGKLERLGRVLDLPKLFALLDRETPL